MKKNSENSENPERTASITRKTAETSISITLNLDVPDGPLCQTGVGFLDHMLTLMLYHGNFSGTIQATGDYHIDDHHTVEDTGITLGQAIKQALATYTGIQRYASLSLPMDEALCHLSLDISNRPFLHYETPDLPPKIGTFDTELIPEFLRAFSHNAGLTLHIDIIRGSNAHHCIEAVFKALGRGLYHATRQNASARLPSTKGIL